MKTVLLAHLAATLFMTGLIWTSQIVHYPLFARVGEDQFRGYHAAHSTLISFVVAAPMLTEALTAVALLVMAPVPLPRWSLWLGAGLVAVVWGATALLQIPAHNALGQGFDEATIRSLVAGNWVRTAAWSARSALALWWTSRLLHV